MADAASLAVFAPALAALAMTAAFGVLNVRWHVEYGLRATTRSGYHPRFRLDELAPSMSNTRKRAKQLIRRQEETSEPAFGRAVHLMAWLRYRDHENPWVPWIWISLGIGLALTRLPLAPLDPQNWFLVLLGALWFLGGVYLWINFRIQLRRSALAMERHAHFADPSDTAPPTPPEEVSRA